MIYIRVIYIRMLSIAITYRHEGVKIPAMIEEQELEELEQKLEELKQSDGRFDTLDILMRRPDTTTDYEALLQQREEAEVYHLQLGQWFAERGYSVKWNYKHSHYEAVIEEKSNLTE